MEDDCDDDYDDGDNHHKHEGDDGVLTLAEGFWSFTHPHHWRSYSH